MQEKSFATCFDKNCEEFAELLMTLVSENPSICNINQKKEVFKKDRAITSNEYVLAIGPDGSKVNRASFPDSYNKYGIHIGYRGRKAWISCENFDWTEKSLGEFHTDLILLLKELGMSTDNIDDRIAENVKKVKTEKSMDGISSISTIDGIIMSSLTTAALTFEMVKKLPLVSLVNKVWQWIDNILIASERRKQQYKLAVVLFYHKYITDFLELKNSANNNAEDEKMNF